MSPIEQRYAEVDDMSAWAQNRFAPIVVEPPAHPPVTGLPVHLANAVVPRRNLCSEFSAMPTEQLMAEAEAAMTRLLQSGRPTDYAVVVALVRRLARKPAMDGALWIDDLGRAA